MKEMNRHLSVLILVLCRLSGGDAFQRFPSNRISTFVNPHRHSPNQLDSSKIIQTNQGIQHHQLVRTSTRVFRKRLTTAESFEERVPVNLFEERITSAKFALTSLFGGVILSLPIVLINGIFLANFNGQWEFNEVARPSPLKLLNLVS
jgi:hypothetical protein